MDETTPEQPPEGGDEIAAEETVESDWERRRRLAAVFGEVLPDTTSDEQDPESAEQRDEAQDRWLRSQVPPHHG
jgi:hypothetical protein